MNRGLTRRIAARRGTGFTLVELALVAAIVVIIGAMAIPRFAGAANRYRVESAARRVAVDLALARSQALAASQAQQVTFQIHSSSYALKNVAPSDPSASGDYTADLAADPYRSRIVSVFGDTTGPVVLSFDGYGSPSTAGTIIVESGGVKRSVVLDITTGKATVQ